MRFSFDVNKEDLLENSKKFRVLGNPIRLRILFILNESPAYLDQIHIRLKKEDLFLYRESTYKSLERLVETGFVNKSYDPKTKKMIYSLIKKN